MSEVVERGTHEERRVELDELDGDRLVDLTVGDLDTLAQAASGDHGAVTVEGVETPDAEPDEVEIEVVTGEPMDAHPADAEPLTNADFGGSDELVTPEDRVVEVLPDIARLAAIAATRTAAWGLGASLRMTRRLARASVDPQAAVDLVEDVGDGVRNAARTFLGVEALEARVDALTPVGDRLAHAPARRIPARREQPQRSPEEALRAQGQELLRQSADVEDDQRLHPAFGRILGELAPDEGRILRLLSADGPQPIVDVRAANLIGVGSQLVAENLGMVGMQAGVRHHDRVEAYLGNLERLGLVTFSDTPVDDAITYQVLEAQPHVMDTILRTSRAKSVHRSLRLTSFGAAFADVCFPREIEATSATPGAGEDQYPSTPTENDEFGS